MKLLEDTFAKLRPLFDQGGRLRPLKPLFDAGENFFLSPSARAAAAPHVRDPLDVKRYMSMVIVALVPCVLASIYFFGLRVLAMIVVSYAAGGAVEVAFAVIRKEEINEGFLVTGLLFPLILPPALPLWMVGVGVFLGVLVGKELFGGTGRNLFNPALVGRCFLALGYPKAMSGNWIAPVAQWPGRITQFTSDTISGATPLVDAANDQWVSLKDLFFGNVSGSAGETSALAIVLGGLVLVGVGVANWRTVASMLLGFVVLTACVHGGSMHVVLWHVLAGGLLFGAFFMATDPITSPMTEGGKWVYGLLIGVATALIRNFTGYVEGVMFAILLGNLFAPVIDEVFLAVHVRRLQREG
ncbi:MAG: RnfABCDGE type electron transport complex subunit D [Planctomycetota bacterium]|jgi:Na(+)-translocating NADH:ubiquinone oxidoreductase B subunit